jgi:hypothetical protein
MAIAMLAGTPLAQAGNVSTGMCNGLEKGERGLCRAALKSGCGVDGQHRNSVHCTKLASNYRRMTGGDLPVWLKRNDPVPLPGPDSLTGE